jgi:hypothetical protein
MFFRLVEISGLMSFWSRSAFERKVWHQSAQMSIPLLGWAVSLSQGLSRERRVFIRPIKCFGLSLGGWLAIKGVIGSVFGAMVRHPCYLSPLDVITSPPSSR